MGEDLLSKIIEIINTLLIKSPFVYLDMIPEVQRTLGIVNYFVPISTMITIMEGWLVAIGIFYVRSVILRKVGAIS